MYIYLYIIICTILIARHTRPWPSGLVIPAPKLNKLTLFHFGPLASDNLNQYRRLRTTKNIYEAKCEQYTHFDFSIFYI